MQKRAIFLPLLFLLAVPSYAQNILILDEQCPSISPSASYFPTAVAILGLTPTVTHSDLSFDTALTSGSWDVVVVDEYNMSLSSATLSDLAAYIASGGKVIMSYYNVDAPIAALFDANFESNYSAPLDIYRWASNPLFTTPNNLSNPLHPTADTCIVDGQLFSPLAGGTALGGYTSGATAGQAAIIMGNGGNTILFGATPGLFNGDTNSNGQPDGLDIAQNLLATVGVAAVPTAPTLSQWGVLAALMALAVAGALRLRF